MSGTTWSKFFWSDWLAEPALRDCTYAARGLWMDMLCIAATHDPIGYVAVAGRGLNETSIARMTGGSESEVSSLLGELERNGVFSRDRHGRIYSRRMIADARKAATAKKNGKKGGNPSLGNNGGNTPLDNPKDNGGLKPHKPEATFQLEQEDIVAAAPPPATRSRSYPPDFERAWKAYPHHPGRSSKPNSMDEWKRLPQEERADLVGCIERFRPNVATACGDKGAPCMSRWIKSGKHLNWLDEPGEEQPGVPAPDPWRRRVAEFVKNGHWNRLDWGPAPGKPGCTVAVGLLAEFNFSERSAA